METSVMAAKHTLNMKLGLIMLALILLNFSCKDDKKTQETETMEAATTTGEDEVARKEEMKAEAASASISGKAMASNDLSTLTTALKSADLASMLSESGSYTVFAPSNNAFSKLKEGTLDDLMKPENKEQLRKLLQYHVVKGKITTGKLADAVENSKGKYAFTTVAGNELTAMMDGGQLVIRDERGNKSQVVQGNIDASNGVIHILNDVLMHKK